MDIQIFKSLGGEDLVVFNGPDEQLVSGLAIGADGGIGGTYGVMSEVYLKIKALYDGGQRTAAAVLQERANQIIYEMCSCHGNLSPL